MPVDDVIFERLSNATTAERAAVARALEVECPADSRAGVETLSRELRRVAGNVLRNLRRDDHELRYAEILEDVVVEAARKAGRPVPFVTAEAWSARAEEYVLTTLAFAARKATATAAEADEAQRKVEDELNELGEAPGAMKSHALKAAMALAVNFDKVVAAVVVLIQIRLRLRAERSLEKAV